MCTNLNLIIRAKISLDIEQVYVENTIIIKTFEVAKPLSWIYIPYGVYNIQEVMSEVVKRVISFLRWQQTSWTR